MGNLQHYLNKYHAETSLEEICEDFMDKFGVGVKQEGDLYQFKYNMLAAKWTRDITHECRGIILRRKDSVWSVASRPFDKFFNQGEGYCPYFQEKDFNHHIGKFWMVEKADGTCIQLWYDHEQERYRVSTLGTITPMGVYDYDFTFADLFWTTLGVNPDDLTDDLFDKDTTYLFELCCAENRILTKYPSNTIFLLGWRGNEHGLHAHRQEQEEWVKMWTDNGYKVKMPYAEMMVSTGLDSLEKVKLFVHEATSMTDVFGEYPEGFVVYDGLKPVAKMKNEQYLSLHHVSGGDVLHTRNVIIDAYFASTLDDIYDHLTDPMKTFADSLKERVEDLFLQVQHIFSDIKTKDLPTQKDYALYVQSMSPKQFWAFFFQKKDKILDATSDKMDLFTDWLALSYKGFMDFWKSQD